MSKLKPKTTGCADCDATIQRAAQAGADAVLARLREDARASALPDGRVRLLLGGGILAFDLTLTPQQAPASGAAPQELRLTLALVEALEGATPDATIGVNVRVKEMPEVEQVVERDHASNITRTLTRPTKS